MELELTLGQKQILSQRMQLSVKILQMNALDLDQYIQESALENPLIELELPQEVEDPGLARLKKLEWLESMDESNFYQYSRGSDESERDMPLYQKRLSDSLPETLLAQLPAFHLPEPEENAARYLIGNLDDNGYLTMTREQLLEESGMEEASLAAALDAVQRMEPAGVGAADLRECLLIQAQRLDDAPPALTGLIEEHLDLLAKNQLAKIAKAMNLTVGDIKEARDSLLALNPKPGNGYSTYNSIPYIRPDLFIVRFEDNFQVILNDWGQPKIEINSYYRKLAQEAGPGSETATYVGDKLRRAEWLVSCIQQRGSTILKCAGSILSRQIGFFETGPGNLAPMSLADVAGDLDLHPSTISRAVRGKYLQCQWGVFGLADFFSRSVGDTGNEQSQDHILGQIRRIIAEEDQAAPFSDQEISARLEKHGIHIARRTVAKYREQMGLPAANGRKQY